MAFAWSELFVACLCSLKRSRSVRLVSPIYCFLHLLHWIIYVRFVESNNVMFNLFRNVLAGGLGVLSLFASFARKSRSRGFGERRKGTTGTSLKIFLKRSVDCRMGCFLRSMSWMLGRAGL